MDDSQWGSSESLFSYVPFVDVFDVRRKDASLHVGTASCKKHIVGVPVEREHRGANRLLEQARDPPVVVRVERAHSDSTNKNQVSA